MDSKKIGQVIKSLRNDTKITQKGLSEKVGCSRSYIADLERGAYNPSIDMLEGIAKALGVNVSYIILKVEKTIPDEYDLSVVKIKNEFPDGITVLKKASDQLTKRQKDDMVELIDWFISKEAKNND